MKLTTLLLLIYGIGITSLFAQKPVQISVEIFKPYAKVQSSMWGVFFEDINFAADGGIYAELVKNRSFEFSRPLMGWREGRMGKANGHILVINRGDEFSNNPHIARLTLNADSGAYTLTNEGFRGMGVKKDLAYNFSILANSINGKTVTLKVQLIKGKDEVIANSDAINLSGDWKKYELSFTCTQTEPKAQLRVLFTGNGELDIDMVSLFPSDTWKERKNGLRADLVQLLAELKPGFVRFPGGCIVEGFDLANRYQWKNTVGKMEDRKLIINRWNTEFPRRSAPDYFQSYGLGFYEYFLLSEDIGAQPLPILNCGMACQYNSGEVVPVEQIDPFIQDALDLIEFANGPVTSKWGKLRSEMGHPAPFNLKMMGIGNEQWDAQYIERFKLFEKVLKEKHPEITLVSSSGPSPDGPRFDYLWKELRTLNAEIVDEHYYKDPAWFLKNATRYDNYDRKGPKVFAGEYASHTGKDEKIPEMRNNWESALTEAAFMTGLERNADVVYMASYAPLLAHVEAWQWRPDMIWFDNLRNVATPNYYVQKLFSTNRGTDVVPALTEGKPLTGSDSLYASAMLDKNSHTVIVKLVNVASVPKHIEVNLNGTKITGMADITVLGSDDLQVYNTLDEPTKVVPKEMKLSGIKNPVRYEVPGRSVIVLKLYMRN